MVEAVAEDLSVKPALFENLDEICQARRDPGHDDVLATRHRARRSDQSAQLDVIGMHFFNPAQVMNLVEVVSTVSTSADVAGPAPSALPGARQARRSRAATAPASS